MRIVVLNSKSSDSAGWHVRELRRAAEARGHGLIACSWRELCGGVAHGCIARAGETVLDDADVILLRAMPPGSLEQIIFRMDLLGRLAAAGVTVINPPRAVEAAVDKYLALARMHDAGLPVPRTIVCQRVDDAMAAFARLGGDVVIKPIFGSEGAGMTRITDADLAFRAFTMLERMGGVLYVQQFIEHGDSDLRLFVLAHRVLATMKRVHENQWRTNIAQGGCGKPFEPDERLRNLAIRAAAACETVIAGVDIVIDARGEPFVLEINSAPGWQALSEACAVDVAAAIIEHLEHHATKPR